MPPHQDKAAELLRSGQYYEQARDWYRVKYIGPLSERNLFLVIGILAALVGLVGFIAFLGLVPLAEKPGLIYKNDRINDAAPSLIRLRNGSEDINDTIKRTLVLYYLNARESYAADSFGRNSLFVTAHSDAAVASQYAAAVNPSNPRSPAALLGRAGTRQVQVLSYNVRKTGETQTATVKFSTEIVSITSLNKTQWTAVIEFLYSDAVVQDTTDPETGKKDITLQEPFFQVVNYALSPS